MAQDNLYRPMSPEQAMHQLNVVMAHLWMVRHFLKHAEELQHAPHLHEVHRQIFDYVRALEPSWQRGDAQEYLRRARGKLHKLQRVAELFAQEYRQVSDHTNFEMAAMSLAGCVRLIAAILNAVSTIPAASISPAPTAGSEARASPGEAPTPQTPAAPSPATHLAAQADS